MNARDREIDWQKLAASLRPSHGIDGAVCGSDAALRALEIIIGEDALRAGVDHYVAVGGGYELARSVLWQLRPWSAMSRCYEIFKNDAQIENRRSAVELLRVVADRRALPWIPEFLSDPDAGIQAWGAGVLDQLLWSELIEPEEAEGLLNRAEQHGNVEVRGLAEFIRSYLRARSRSSDEQEPNESGPEV